MNFQSIYAKTVRRMRGVERLRSYIPRSSKVEPGSKIISSTFGRHSFCGYDCVILNADIGAFCSLANRVSIGGAHHPTHYLSTSPVFLSHRDSVTSKFSRHDYLPTTRTTIGNDVWIGEGCLIKPGVRIGHGAVVGMGSIVTRSVPDYAIVAGNPAKLIRMRFDEEVVRALLDLKWWDMSDYDLYRIGPMITDPEALLRHEGFL